MSYHDLKSKPMFTLGMASRLTDISSKTLTNYEQAGLTSVSRSPGGRRLYSERDIFIIQLIQFLLNDQRMTYSGVKFTLKLLTKAQKRGFNLLPLIIPRSTRQRFINKIL